MGGVDQENTPPGQAYEMVLPWGPIMRGVRWGSGQPLVLFAHEPGGSYDLDAWGDLPARVAATLDVTAVVVDLPGHGFSDDPWEPARFPEIISVLVGEADPEHPQLVVAAAESAIAALKVAADHSVAGIAALSPALTDPESTLPRSPRTAKLMFAGAQDGDNLVVSRRLASTLGGWAVVTSIPTDTRGTGMLSTEWGPRLREHIVAFARDVLFRRPSPTPMRQDSMRDR